MSAVELSLPAAEIWLFDESRIGHIVAALHRGGTGELVFDELYEVHEGIAVIPITGVLVKGESFFGDTSLEVVRQAVDKAAHDDSVEAILLQIDSPGGVAAAAPPAADAIFEARTHKPIVAQVVGLCASAAYYLASQCNEIFAERMDLIGSIGILWTALDRSKEFAAAGVEVVEIKTGPLKGLGVPGTEITKAQRTHIQGLVDGYFADLIDAIQRGRRMTEKEVRALADGGVMFARDAKTAGLIDGVQTLDETLAALALRAAPEGTPPPMPAGREHRRSVMAEPDGMAPGAVLTTLETKAATPVAASYAEIVEACPGASTDFICAQLKAEATTAQATKAWMQTQAAALTQAGKDKEAAATASAAELADVQKKAGIVGQAATGVESVAGGTGSEGTVDGGAVAKWNEEVASRVKAGLTPQVAVAKADQANPGLREKMLAEVNG